MNLPLRFAVLVIVLAAAPSSAAESVVGVEAEAPPELRNYVNLRGGATTSAKRPYLCIDAAPLSFLSFEACGTGAGLLHRDPEPEIAHFRAGIRPTYFRIKSLQLEPRLMMGFAEVQIGEDDPGFQFGGTGPRGVETAGPEAGVSLRALYPISHGVELVGDLNASMLWVPHGPKLVRPGRTFQPTFSFTLGVGF